MRAIIPDPRSLDHHAGFSFSLGDRFGDRLPSLHTAFGYCPLTLLRPASFSDVFACQVNNRARLLHQVTPALRAASIPLLEPHLWRQASASVLWVPAQGDHFMTVFQ